MKVLNDSEYSCSSLSVLQSSKRQSHSGWNGSNTRKLRCREVEKFRWVPDWVLFLNEFLLDSSPPGMQLDCSPPGMQLSRCLQTISNKMMSRGLQRGYSEECCITETSRTQLEPNPIQIVVGALAAVAAAAVASAFMLVEKTAV